MEFPKCASGLLRFISVLQTFLTPYKIFNMIANITEYKKSIDLIK